MRRTLLSIGLAGLLLAPFAGAVLPGTPFIQTASATHEWAHCHKYLDVLCCSEYEPIVYDDETDTGLSQGSRGERVLTVAGTFYVDAREVNSGGSLLNVWIYQETNGEEGYQYEGCGKNGGDTIVF